MSAIYINGEPVVQSNFPEMTLAQYNSLPVAERPEFWVRTDASYDSIPGTSVTFNNEGTTIESTDVDGAIKEVDANRKEDLTSISESGTTASQAISARTYFYLDGILVRAKVDIANGATFTLNTNYEVVTAGALNENDTIVTKRVNITATSSSSPYVCPCDGYAVADARASGDFIFGRVLGTSGSASDGNIPFSARGSNVCTPIFVRKGMSVYVENKSGSSCYMWFYKLG